MNDAKIKRAARLLREAHGLMQMAIALLGEGEAASHQLPSLAYKINNRIKAIEERHEAR